MAAEQVAYYHRDLKEWGKALKFYKDEISMLEIRLREVVEKNTKPALLAEAEHFQNQFILQDEQFDILQHNINEQDRTIGKNLSSESVLINKPALEAQHSLRDKVHAAEKIFIETKHDFYRFLSKVF